METMEIAKVTSKGQVTIPISVRKLLGIKEGDKVMFVARGGKIRMINASLVALRELQQGFDGVAEELGLKNEQDVVDMIKEVRAERAAGR